MARRKDVMSRQRLATAFGSEEVAQVGQVHVPEILRKNDESHGGRDLLLLRRGDETANVTLE